MITINKNNNTTNNTTTNTWVPALVKACIGDFEVVVNKTIRTTTGGNNVPCWIFAPNTSMTVEYEKNGQTVKRTLDPDASYSYWGKLLEDGNKIADEIKKSVAAAKEQGMEKVGYIKGNPTPVAAAPAETKKEEPAAEKKQDLSNLKF